MQTSASAHHCRTKGIAGRCAHPWCWFALGAGDTDGEHVKHPPTAYFCECRSTGGGGGGHLLCCATIPSARSLTQPRLSLTSTLCWRSHRVCAAIYSAVVDVQACFHEPSPRCSLRLQRSFSRNPCNPDDVLLPDSRPLLHAHFCCG